MRYIDATQIIVRTGTKVIAEHQNGFDVNDIGTITDIAPVDPDGNAWDGVVEVTFDNGIDFYQLDELAVVVNA